MPIHLRFHEVDVVAVIIVYGFHASQLGQIPENYILSGANKLLGMR